MSRKNISSLSLDSNICSSQEDVLLPIPFLESVLQQVNYLIKLVDTLAANLACGFQKRLNYYTAILAALTPVTPIVPPVTGCITFSNITPGRGDNSYSADYVITPGSSLASAAPLFAGQVAFLDSAGNAYSVSISGSSGSADIISFSGLAPPTTLFCSPTSYLISPPPFGLVISSVSIAFSTELVQELVANQGGTAPLEFTTSLITVDEFGNPLASPGVILPTFTSPSSPPTSYQAFICIDNSATNTAGQGTPLTDLTIITGDLPCASVALHQEVSGSVTSIGGIPPGSIYLSAQAAFDASKGGFFCNDTDGNGIVVTLVNGSYIIGSGSPLPIDIVC